MEKKYFENSIMKDRLKIATEIVKAAKNCNN